MPLRHLLLSSVFIFFVLYAPQPLLGLFAEQFTISPATAGSLMTATMLPLAIAPLLYGLLLAKRSPVKVLKVAMLTLAFTCVLFSHAPNFELLLLIRFLQGLTLPAALTAMTSYIGVSFQGQQLQKNMTLYIGSTIIGGYLGRMLSALFADLFTWQEFYYVIAVTLVILALMIPKTQKSTTITSQNSPLNYLKQLSSPPLIKLYISVFCMFFCFAALLNFLPFILKERFLITNTRDIGLVYSGYLLGAIASITSPWLSKKCHSPWQLLLIIFVVYCLTIILLTSTEFIIFISAFSVFCAAMFIIHSTAAPLANKISLAPASVTNGAYVSFYYSGGALGSYLPGLIYQAYGHIAFLGCLLALCLLGLVMVYLAGKKTTLA